MLHDSEIAAYCAAAYEYKTFSVNDLETLITTTVDGTDNAVVVTVRGTEITNDFSLFDIIRDLRFLPMPDKDSGISHAGMLWGANLVARELARRLKETNRQRLPLYLGGHSLGAGVSLLMVPEMARRGYHVKKWVGLGTPRVVWHEGNRWRYAGVPLHAYRYGRDLVTYLPPTWLGYELPDIVKTFRVGTPTRPWPNISDHWVTKYLEAIEKRG